MAGYGGYFLQGLSSGLQTGFNMGQMKWQQNEKKKLEKKQQEMEEVSSVFNNIVAQLGEDGLYSDDDIMKINTSYMALGFDVKERVDGTYKAIQAMDKKAIEANYQWFDLVLNATTGMKSGDAQEIWDTVRPFVSGEKGLQVYDALESITKKRSEAMTTQFAPETFGTAGEVTEAYPEAGYKYTKEGYVPEFQKPAAEKAPTAIEQKIAGINNLPIPDEQKLKMKIKIYGGGDTALEQKIGKAYEHGATDEEVKDMIVGRGIEIKITPETLGTLGSWEERFESAKTKTAFKREQNLLEQSEDKYVPPYADWKERLVALTKERATYMRKLLDEKGKLRNVEWKTDWKEMVERYNKHIMELQTDYPDVDLSQFSKFNEWTALGLFSLIDEEGW